MTRSDEPCSQSLDGIHILLVDDQQDSRDMLRYALEGYGALVTVAASAEHAVTLFWQVRPNVLVTDLSMPGGLGRSAANPASRARSRCSWGGSPVTRIAGVLSPPRCSIVRRIRRSSYPRSEER